MKVFLLKNIEKIGMAGEILKVSDGYAKNYLIPRKFAVEITKKNEDFYATKVRVVEQRKEVIATHTSMLSDKISTLKLSMKRKTHDDGQLYAAITEKDIVSLFSDQGIAITKRQVMIKKHIKSTGEYPVTIKLSSKLQPVFTLSIKSL